MEAVETRTLFELAETLEPSTIEAEMSRYQTRRKPTGLFRSAWNHAEYGLNQSFEYDDTLRKQYFHYAQELLGAVILHPDTHQDTLLSSLVLSTYIPLLQKRSLGEEITSNDCRQVYGSLGEAIGYMQPLETDQPPQWPLAEVAVLALSARISRPDLLLYPSSPREENSKVQAYNHDSYFIQQHTKVPIQQKLIETTKEYDEWITILTLRPILRRAYKKHADTAQITSAADEINYVLALIVSESNGVAVSDKELKLLDHLSSAIASHRSSTAKNTAA
jgi:hypothetical protein